MLRHFPSGAAASDLCILGIRVYSPTARLQPELGALSIEYFAQVHDIFLLA
jgi:hypothetical protein